ncbi:MAG TPA: amidase [Vicinamibacteria bacterium]|nr:amidase [Vicinamibacteria bacterium]
MDRRRFLGYSALGSATLVTSTFGCAPAERTTSEGSSQAPPAGEEPFELHEATVAELQEGMSSGRLTARSIAEAYLRRIEALDRQGPELRSIIEINPEALEIADELDAERQSNGPRGPLHGIPVALKDNIDTHDRMTTTAGSLALEGSIPPQDSFVAQKLREAGALLLAKANMSEWAYWRGFKASSGWSARGGQCRNPYALDRNPCGSSSGSGVAAAANLCALTVGTETGGSIMCPSSINGIVGIKPTVGVWSRAGIIPISHSQDTAGPMTRTLRDAAILLGAATGVDPRDDATAASEGNFHTDYTEFLDPNGLRGARIGVARNFPNFDERVLALFDRAIEDMRAAGAEIIDPADIPSMDNADVFSELPTRVLNYEFKANINKYFASLGPNAPIKSLTELIAFNEANRDREMPYFGQERLLASEESGPLTDPPYLEALSTIQRHARAEGIDAVVGQHRLDAIVAPTRDPAWKTDHIMGDRLQGGSSAGLAAIAGYPDISIPMGFVSGLPVGISFFGPRWSEPTLLKVAYGFEQLTKHRQAPNFLETLG